MLKSFLCHTFTKEVVNHSISFSRPNSVCIGMCVSITSLKHGCRDPGSDWSPHNGIRHGYLHSSVPLHTDGCLTHTHLHLHTDTDIMKKKYNSVNGQIFGRIENRILFFSLWVTVSTYLMCFHCHYEEWWSCSRCSRCELVKNKVKPYLGRGVSRGADILEDTRRRIGLVRSHTGTDTCNWSSCTHRCLWTEKDGRRVRVCDRSLIRNLLIRGTEIDIRPYLIRWEHIIFLKQILGNQKAAKHLCTKFKCGEITRSSLLNNLFICVLKNIYKIKIYLGLQL